MLRFMYVALVLFAPATMGAVVPCRQYCIPSNNTCWPSKADVTTFSQSLSVGVNGVILPESVGYDNDIRLKDLLFTKWVAMIVYVETVDDIKKTMKFAQDNDILFRTRSSGHSFLGRSSATDSLMMDVSKMKGITVDLNDPRNTDGTVTVEPGNIWIDVYKEVPLLTGTSVREIQELAVSLIRITKGVGAKEMFMVSNGKVDKVKRLVVGGSSHTVSVSGYMMGGGHSPLTRSLGLAVDNVISFTIITADRLVRTCTKTETKTVRANSTETTSTNTDLFWAVRGGGGGIFGVVTSITFKLHLPPTSFVRFLCSFPYDLADGTIIGDDVINKFSSLILNLPSQWGGYVVLTSNIDPQVNYAGYVTFSMLHYGGWSESTLDYLKPIKDLYVTRQFFCFYVNYTTFLEYENTIDDPVYVRSYINNQLLQPSSFKATLTSYFNKLIYTNPKRAYALYGCTYVLVGGLSSVEPVPSAVTSKFRTALSSTTCYAGWDDTGRDQELMDDIDAFQVDYSAIGGASYYNEPNANLANWKDEFWGGKYDRLLLIKDQYDPKYFFNCPRCIGSDLTKGKPCSGNSYVISTLLVICCILSTML